MRTFHARRGRLGPQLTKALEVLMPVYGVPSDFAAHPATLFDAVDGVVLEIGSGMGDATLSLAHREPHLGVIATDVHTRGVAALLRGIDAEHITTVRVLHGDALALVRRLPTESLVGIRVWFPDPWPKARHHKRRLIQPSVVSLLASRLVSGGTLHLATDWAEYADQMAQVLSAEPALTVIHGADDPRPEWRPVTRYERAARKAHRPVADFIAERRG